MANQGAQWMTDDEIAQWKGEQKAPASTPKEEPAKTRKAQKSTAPTKARLNAMLLAAAASGDARAAQAAIEQGADPNTRARANPQPSALGVALSGFHDQASLVILRAGGRVAPQQWGRNSKDTFASDVESGCPELKNKTLHAFIYGASQWRSIVAASQVLESPATMAEMAAAKMLAQHFSVVRQAFEAGVDLAQAWAGQKHFLSYQSQRPMDLQPSERAALLGMIKDPKAIAGITEDMAHRFYRSSIQHDDTEFLRALLDAGLRPSADWSVDCKNWNWTRSRTRAPENEDQRMGALNFSATVDGGGAYALLKGFAPVVRAAASRKDSPWLLCDINVGRLMELQAMGSPIDGCDSHGRSVLHVWAEKDSAPRSGWATMAKEAPELFAKVDDKGRTAAERMAGALRGEEAKNAFMASLSRIEGRELRREASRPSAKAAPASKRL